MVRHLEEGKRGSGGLRSSLGSTITTAPEAKAAYKCRPRGPPVRQRREPPGISHHDPEAVQCTAADGNQVERPSIAQG